MITPEDASRQRWMSLLARADEARLEAVWSAAGLAPDFGWLRSPEAGTVMVRGRAGATGAAFNLGEMTVTRCALRLDSGTVGHGYVAGRSRRKAEIAALCDALLQEDGAAARTVRERVLDPLRDAAREAREARAARAAATRVEFFTLARGET